MCVQSLVHSKPSFLHFTDVCAGRPLCFVWKSVNEKRAGLRSFTHIIRMADVEARWSQGSRFYFSGVPPMHRLWMVTFSFSFFDTLLMLSIAFEKKTYRWRGCCPVKFDCFAKKRFPQQYALEQYLVNWSTSGIFPRVNVLNHDASVALIYTKDIVKFLLKTIDSVCSHTVFWKSVVFLNQ